METIQNPDMKNQISSTLLIASANAPTQPVLRLEDGKKWMVKGTPVSESLKSIPKVVGRGRAKPSALAKHRMHQLACAQIGGQLAQPRDPLIIEEVLRVILKHLPCVRDRISFSRVCKIWNVVSDKKCIETKELHFLQRSEIPHDNFLILFEQCPGLRKFAANRVRLETNQLSPDLRELTLVESTLCAETLAVGNIASIKELVLHDLVFTLPQGPAEFPLAQCTALTRLCFGGASNNVDAARLFEALSRMANLQALVLCGEFRADNHFFVDNAIPRFAEALAPLQQLKELSLINVAIAGHESGRYFSELVVRKLVVPLERLESLIVINESINLTDSEIRTVLDRWITEQPNLRVLVLLVDLIDVYERTKLRISSRPESRGLPDKPVEFPGLFVGVSRVIWRRARIPDTPNLRFRCVDRPIAEYLRQPGMASFFNGVWSASVFADIARFLYRCRRFAAESPKDTLENEIKRSLISLPISIHLSSQERVVFPCALEYRLVKCCLSVLPHPDLFGVFPKILRGETGFKISSDMETIQNPDMKNQISSTLLIASANAPTQPVLRLEDGKKWIVENFHGNKALVVETSDKQQVASIRKCVDSAIEIKNEIHSITLDSCKKISVVIDSLVSSITVINCQDVQIQARGQMPLVTVTGSDGCQLFLSKDSLNAQIISSKSSETNACIGMMDFQIKFPGLLLQIFELLAVRDRFNVAKVCRRWNEISQMKSPGTKELDFLRMSKVPQEAAALELIARCPKLPKLAVNRIRLSLAQLSRGLLKLELIESMLTAPTPPVPEFSQLKELVLHDVVYSLPNGPAAFPLAQCVALTRLHFRDVGDRVGAARLFEALSRMTSLEALVLSGEFHAAEDFAQNAVTRFGQALAPLQQLKELSLIEVSIGVYEPGSYFSEEVATDLVKPLRQLESLIVINEGISLTDSTARTLLKRWSTEQPKLRVLVFLVDLADDDRVRIPARPEPVVLEGKIVKFPKLLLGVSPVIWRRARIAATSNLQFECVDRPMADFLRSPHVAPYFEGIWAASVFSDIAKCGMELYDNDVFQQ